MKRILYFLSFLLLLTSCSGKKDNKTISIGYINWDDGIALTHLVEVILEQQGYRVILKNVIALKEFRFFISVRVPSLVLPVSLTDKLTSARIEPS